MASHSPDIYAETLAVFDRGEGYEPLTTPEVADALDANRRTVYKRLQKLVDRGELETKETGSNSRVWWQPPTGSGDGRAVEESGESPASAGGERDRTEAHEVVDELLPGGATTDREEPLDDESGRQLRGMLDALGAAVFLKGTDGRYLLANRRCRELFGVDGADVVGKTDADLFPEDVATEYRADDERAVETGEAVEEEAEIPTPDGERTALIRKTPVCDEDGDPAAVCGVAIDITERTEREQELRAAREFNEELVENAPFGMFRLDEDLRITYENPRAEELIGLPDEKDESDAIGVDFRELPPVVETGQADLFDKLKDGETIEFEFPFESIYGREAYFTGRSVPLYRDGEFDGAVLMAKDISERRQREEELRAARQFNEELVENAPFGMFRLDEDLRITYENPRAEELIGLPDEKDESDAIGVDFRELPPVVETGQAHLFDQLKDGETIEFEFPFESIYGREAYFTGRSVPLYRDGEFDGAVLMAKDISERRQREEELRAAREFNEELVENAPFGMFRLDEELRITYENPRAEEIIGLPDDKDQSDAIGVDFRELPPVVETGQAHLFDQLEEGETVEFEFPFESIYGREAYFTGRSVPLYRDGEFDGAVLMAKDISERRQRERELVRQREQLAALDDINGVFRGITDAVIDQSTREEIEQVVCDRLADSDSYRSAWICAVDSNLQLEPRVEAGIDDPLTEISLPADPDDQDGGLVGSAVRTQEVRTSQNGPDGREGVWPQGATVESAAAVPIVHQGMLYGVLGVCSERPDAFAGEERAVIGQLGEVIGHAITAVERKRALMSDEVIEIEIRIPKLLESRDAPVTTDGTVTIERTVPLGDDEYLLYGTATGDAIDAVRALGERLPDWKAVRVVDETDDTVRFEQRITNPPLTSTVADHGGHFVVGRIEDGALTATIHLPPGTDIRRVVADVSERYPNVEFVSQHQVTRTDPSPRQLRSVLTEELTKRQRAALEAGYHGGFFEWPRDGSGEDIATSLDIGASTFHQHLRKAEKKLLDVVFADR